MAAKMSREERLALGIQSISQPLNAEIIAGELAGQRGTMLGQGPSHYDITVSVFEGGKFIRHAGRLVFARCEVRIEA